MQRVNPWPFLLFLVTGLIASAAGCYFLGRAFGNSAQARRAAELPLAVGAGAETGEIAIAADELTQVTVAVRIESTSVISARTDSGGELKLRFKFPFEYAIANRTGKILHEEKTAITWDEGTKHGISDRSTSSGGWIEFEASFEKVAVAESPVRVRARLDSDAEFGAVARRATLIIYDNVRRVAADSVYGAVLLAVAGLCFAGSFIMYFVGGLNASKMTELGERHY